MGFIQAIKIYLAGEDWSKFTPKELGETRLFNIIVIIINLWFYVIWDLLILEIAFMAIICHYAYREYLLEKYIFTIFKKK